MFCQEKSAFKVICFIDQKSKKRFFANFFIVLTLNENNKASNKDNKIKSKKGSLLGFRGPIEFSSN